MLLFQEGWDAYTVTADLVNSNRWASTLGTVTYSTSAGRFGGGAFQIINPAGVVGQLTGSRWPVIGSPTTCVSVAMWVKFSAPPALANGIFRIYDTAQALWFNGYISSTGTYQTGSQDAVRIGFAGNICDNQWHWIETTWQWSSSTNWITCATIDGYAQAGGGGGLSNHGFTAAQYKPAIMNYLLGTTTITGTFDDVFVWDDQTGTKTGDIVAGVTGSGTTASVNTIGPKRIRTGFPTAAGSNTGFSPSAGSNWQNVDEFPNNSDTDYNSGSASGIKDTFIHSTGNLVPAGETPSWILSNSVMKNNDVGSLSFRGESYNGSIDHGVTQVINSSAYRHYWQPFFRDPSGATWTATTANANEFGYGIA